MNAMKQRLLGALATAAILAVGSAAAQQTAPGTGLFVSPSIQPPIHTRP